MPLFIIVILYTLYFWDLLIVKKIVFVIIIIRILCTNKIYVKEGAIYFGLFSLKQAIFFKKYLPITAGTPIFLSTSSYSWIDKFWYFAVIPVAQ